MKRSICQVHETVDLVDDEEDEILFNDLDSSNQVIGEDDNNEVNNEKENNHNNNEPSSSGSIEKSPKASPTSTSSILLQHKPISITPTKKPLPSTTTTTTTPKQNDKLKDVECPFCLKPFMAFKIQDHVAHCQASTSPLKKQNVNGSKVLNNYFTPKNQSNQSSQLSNNITNYFSNTSNSNNTSNNSSNSNNTSNNNDINVNNNNNSSLNNVDNNSNSNNNLQLNEKEKIQLNLFKRGIPLAERMRPLHLDDLVGQSQLFEDNSLLLNMIKSGDPPSFLLWGPPGCGKTTIANLIEKNTKSSFIKISATHSGVSELKTIVQQAQGSSNSLYKRKTILFVDEIHRFNKSQQDFLLPYVENGTFTLIGATTENPSFEVNGALLSRCRVFKLQKLSKENISIILSRAIDAYCKYTTKQVTIDDDALELLSNFADGDARSALNIIEMIIKGTSGENINIDTTKLSTLTQNKTFVHDKKGDNHYNLISALHKAIRGSDANASTYWITRMLESGTEPLFIARRMIRMASEDIGLADPLAMGITVAAFQAVQFVGMPEASLSLLQAAVYLAQAPKSNSLEIAYIKTREFLHSNPSHHVPLHICNAPTELMSKFGYHKGYQYNHDFEDQSEVTQTYLPEPILNEVFFQYKQTCKGVERPVYSNISSPPVIAENSVYKYQNPDKSPSLNSNKPHLNNDIKNNINSKTTIISSKPTPDTSKQKQHLLPITPTKPKSTPSNMEFDFDFS